MTEKKKTDPADADTDPILTMPARVLPATIVVPSAASSMRGSSSHAPPLGPASVALASLSLQASITKALAGVDPGHGHAFLTFDGGEAGFGIAHKGRIGDRFELGVVVNANYDLKTKDKEITVGLDGTW